MAANARHQVDFASLEDVAGETFDDLVLRGQVHLGEGFLHLGAHLGQFSVKRADFRVLRLRQESQVANLVLKLAIGCLPLEVYFLRQLSRLNHVEVQLVVFLNQALVLLLERGQGLLIEFVLCVADSELILRPLVGLGGLEELGKESLNECAALDICGMSIKLELLKGWQ